MKRRLKKQCEKQKFNPFRTDIQYVIKKRGYLSITNNEVLGFCYDFTLDYESVQSAKRLMANFLGASNLIKKMRLLCR